MNRKNHHWKIPVILFLFSLIFIINPASALVKVEPSSKDISIFSSPQQFTLNITINSVNNVYGFQFDLGYNSNILDVVSVSEGKFLSRSGQDGTFCVNYKTDTPGLVKNVACSRMGSGSVSGNGILANVTFKLKSITSFPAVSNVVLSEVKISDINSQSLDNSKQDGLITIYECLSGETRSCTINSCQGTKTCDASNHWGACVAGSPQTEICNGLDDDCDGSVDEGLSRACSDNHKGICSTGTETCSNGAWSGCPSPAAEICDNGVDEDCNGQDSTCLGDADGNRCVNILDMVVIGLNFGKNTGFEARADRNNDGKVDIFDLVTVGKDFGYGTAC